MLMHTTLGAANAGQNRRYELIGRGHDTHFRLLVEESWRLPFGLQVPVHGERVLTFPQRSDRVIVNH